MVSSMQWHSADDSAVRGAEPVNCAFCPSLPPRVESQHTGGDLYQAATLE